MAVITVTGPKCVARLSEPESGYGEYVWQAVCGEASEELRTDILEDALEYASAHVDACER